MYNKTSINYDILKNNFSFAINKFTMYSKIKALRFPVFLLATFFSLPMWFDQQDIILSKLFNSMSIIFLLCVISVISKNKDD